MRKILLATVVFLSLPVVGVLAADPVSDDQIEAVLSGTHSSTLSFGGSGSSGGASSLTATVDGQQEGTVNGAGTISIDENGNVTVNQQ